MRGSATQATGGPFLPVNLAAKFDDHVNALQTAFRRLDALSLRIDRLPLSPPLRDTYVTSGFGNRIDPFLGTMAMHSGIDFAAATGTPVPAVAGGTVTEAGDSGGYGNMVEIDHGNGLSTRYGHLSRILVKAGDKVARGQEIAESGSTGRSTGPHLHYEIRRNGEPIDPQTFLEAGRELGISSYRTELHAFGVFRAWRLPPLICWASAVSMNWFRSPSSTVAARCFRRRSADP